MSSNNGALPHRIRQLRTLLPYLAPYRKSLLVGGLMVLLTNATAAASPWILRLAIDHLTTEIRPSILAAYAGLLILASLIEGTFRFSMRHILIGASRHVEYDLRNSLFRHLQTLSASFYRRSSTGDIMARATNDLNAVRMVLGPAFMYFLNTCFTAVFVISILVAIQWQLALITLLPLIAVSICVKFFGKRIHNRFERIQEQFSSLNTLVQENIAGIRVVKAYGEEDAFTRRFREGNSEYLQRSLRLVRLSGAFHPLLRFLLGLSIVGLLWWGGRLVVSGQISVGDFVAFMAYLGMLTWPTIALGWVINIVERGSASMGRINAVFAEEPDVRDNDPGEGLQIRGDIEIDDLTFLYDGVLALRNISLHIRSGETLAIVGATGSGKSTLVNLLCRLHPVPDGTIRIDGTDINRIPLSTLRSSIGYVPQETFLFSETVGANISFGSPGSNQEQIRRAAEISDVRKDIESFPAGYDTFVGERGITLSGGQKQRVAISRALLLNTPILVFDDSLSAVDTETEDRILRRLSEQVRKRTTILISHRISTVKSADQIIVLEHGRVVESGTHEGLLASDGYYSSLYQKQLLREELGIA